MHESLMGEGYVPGPEAERCRVQQDKGVHVGSRRTSVALLLPRPHYRKKEAMHMRAGVAALLSLPLVCFVAVPVRGDVRSVSAKDDVARLPAPSAQLYADTTLFPQPTKWRDSIPWVLDLDEAVRLARTEKR